MRSLVLLDRLVVPAESVVDNAEAVQGPPLDLLAPARVPDRAADREELLELGQRAAEIASANCAEVSRLRCGKETE